MATKDNLRAAQLARQLFDIVCAVLVRVQRQVLRRIL